MTKPKDVEYPPWLLVELFEDYIANRKELKKPATSRAQRMLIKKMKGFIDRGFQQKTIWETSIINNWTDIYEPKQPKNAPAVRNYAPPPQKPKDDKVWTEEELKANRKKAAEILSGLKIKILN